VITDPPYEIRHASSHGASWEGQQIAGDLDTSARDRALMQCVRVCFGPIFVFGLWQKPIPQGSKHCLIWDKGIVGSGDLTFPWKPSWEMIFVIGDGEFLGPRDNGVIRGYTIPTWETPGICGNERRFHPHQKPVSLIQYLIGKMLAQTILDPFLGSGTTAVAAKKLGRHFLGFEISPEYCKTAEERIALVEAQPTLFEKKAEQLDLEA
jgi:DNA modification methylase